MNKDTELFPVLETPRLQLRALRFSDAAALFALRSNAQVNTFLDRPVAISIEEMTPFIEKIQKNFETGEGFWWAVTQKGEDCLVGGICIFSINPEECKAEIGYELLPEFQGKGIMQEALEVVIRFGFERLQLKMIEAWSKIANERSMRILEKFNFKRAENPEDEYLVYTLKREI